MFAKIKNNVVVEWPILNIFQVFPNTSFPSPLTDNDLPEGYVMVGTIPIPEIKETQKAIPGIPILQNSKWVQSWQVVDMSSEEIEERKLAKSNDVTAQRNQLLSVSDWTQGKDIPDSISEAWASYRQSLRDITNQPGYPYSIEWPVQP